MTAKQFVEQEYEDSFFNPEPEHVFDLMTKYARLMCDKQKQICADNAKTKDDSDPLSYTTYYVIDPETILNSPYPEELL